MTPFTRNLHRVAVVVQFISMVVFARAYALDPSSWGWALMTGWAAFFGARSLAALQKRGGGA